jgi:hypothetical protein
MEQAPGTAQQTEPTLGEVAINKEAFDLDLKINEGYQNYSSELLRLALVTLGGLGAVWLKIYLPPVPGHRPSNLTGAFLISAFLSAALSAGAALIHRYVAADSLAYHLVALRRRKRNRPGTPPTRPSDATIAAKEDVKRNARFLWSGRLLRISVFCLFVGLLLFCASMAFLMF